MTATQGIGYAATLILVAGVIVIVSRSMSHS
jgi:hypothetical protein